MMSDFLSFAKETTVVTMASLLFSIVFGGLAVIAVILYLYPKTILLILRRWNIIKFGFKVRNITLKDSYNFSYLERGSKKECKATILLLHGFSASKDNFCTMSKYIPNSFHLISLDLPGHGDTTRRMNDSFTPDAQVARVKEFVDLMKMTSTKFHILGLSMGGHIAGLYAATHCEDLQSASLLCPSGIETDGMGEVWKLYLEEGKMYLLPDNLEEMKKMFKFVMHRTIPIPDLIMKGFIQLRIPHKKFYERVLKDVTHEDNRCMLQKSMKNVKCPTLVIWGKQDRTLPVAGAKVLKDGLSEGTVHELDDCGHCIHLERPRKATNLILEFFKTVSPDENKA